MDAGLLQVFTTDLLCALGAPADTAAIVAESLVTADRLGYTTHGTILMPLYSQMISAGVLDPVAQPEVAAAAGATVRIDGGDGYGQLAARLAVSRGSELARENGVAVVGIRNGGHLGRLGEWAQLAASAEMLFLAFCNSGGGARNVAPFGGHRRMLSTNPLAFGVPAFGALPHDVIVDVSTSQVAGSLIREHFLAGKPLEPGWVATAEGEPLTDAARMIQGEGVMLPLGGLVSGHKGYALAVIAEIFAGIAGGLMVGEHDPEWFSNAALFLFVDPKRFIPGDELGQRISSLAAYLQEDGARLPGAGAKQRDEKVDQEGLELPKHICSALKALAAELHLEIPTDLPEIAAAEERSNEARTW